MMRRRRRRQRRRAWRWLGTVRRRRWAQRWRDLVTPSSLPIPRPPAASRPVSRHRQRGRAAICMRMEPAAAPISPVTPGVGTRPVVARTPLPRTLPPSLIGAPTPHPTAWRLSELALFLLLPSRTAAAASAATAAAPIGARVVVAAERIVRWPLARGLVIPARIAPLVARAIALLVATSVRAEPGRVLAHRRQRRRVAAMRRRRLDRLAVRRLFILHFFRHLGVISAEEIGKPLWFVEALRAGRRHVGLRIGVGIGIGLDVGFGF